MGRVREETYQVKVSKWMLACFGQKVLTDSTLINPIFLEEALELCRVNGMKQEEAHKAVDYVYGLEKLGSISQEIGGVMVTLAALAGATRQDIVGAGLVELKRNWDNLDKIKMRLYYKAIDAMDPAKQIQTDFCIHEYRVLNTDYVSLVNHLTGNPSYYGSSKTTSVINVYLLAKMAKEKTDIRVTLANGVLLKNKIDLLKLAATHVKYIEISSEG
jgi:hypothetical protein